MTLHSYWNHFHCDKPYTIKNKNSWEVEKEEFLPHTELGGSCNSELFLAWHYPERLSVSDKDKHQLDKFEITPLGGSKISRTCKLCKTQTSFKQISKKPVRKTVQKGPHAMLIYNSQKEIFYLI